MRSCDALAWRIRRDLRPQPRRLPFPDSQPPRLDEPKLRQQLRNSQCVTCSGFFLWREIVVHNVFADRGFLVTLLQQKYDDARAYFALRSRRRVR